MKISPLDRILLLAMCLLAAWQVAVGIEGLGAVPIFAYTVAFGVLLVAGLLLIILGFEVLESAIVVIVSTIIPLSLSLGLVWEHLASWQVPYLVFVLAGFMAVIVTRTFRVPSPFPIIVIALVHGIAGLTIFILPLAMVFNGARPGFALVGLGGALIGLGGLLLSFLKVGQPILSRETILRFFPLLLLLASAAFVAGFVLA